MVVRNSTVLELLCPFLVNWPLTPSIQKGCQTVPKHKWVPGLLLKGRRGSGLWKVLPLCPLMGTGHQRTQSSSIVILLSMYCIGTGQIDLPGQLADGRVRENLSPFSHVGCPEGTLLPGTSLQCEAVFISLSCQ